MEIFISVMLFVLGTCLGSFYACIGYRIPNKISTVKPNSFCPKCNKPLKWFMNIPLFSFIFLRGKCGYCKEKISPMYFIIELFTGVSFLISYLYFGISMELFIILVLISVLSVTIVTDFNYYYISDRVIIIGSISLILIRLYYLGGKETIYYIVSGLVMFLLLLIIKLIGDKVFKRESLGGGDIKLMFLIGLSLGVIDGVSSMLISSSLALIISLIFLKKNEEGIIPFGPFLLIGASIMFVLAYNGIGI